MKSLPLVFLLTLFVCLPLSGAPSVTFSGGTTTVTLPPGHTVAYAVYSNRYRVGAVTDSDLDGVISILLVTNGNYVFVDVDSGEWIYNTSTGAPAETPLPLTSIVKGPNGAFSQIVLPTSLSYSALWVRPGVGVWAAEVLSDQDQTQNGHLFYSSTAMGSLGSSPATRRSSRSWSGSGWIRQPSSR